MSEPLPVCWLSNWGGCLSLVVRSIVNTVEPNLYLNERVERLIPRTKQRVKCQFALSTIRNERENEDLIQEMKLNPTLTPFWVLTAEGSALASETDSLFAPSSQSSSELSSRMKSSFSFDPNLGITRILGLETSHSAVWNSSALDDWKRSIKRERE